MYEEFYGFRDNPFRLTPDPDYLFLSANHQEALGHLLFGISEGSGVVVITGEIGAGKTTLLRTLVRDLDAQTIVAYIFNPALSALELLQTINADLGLPATSTSKKDLIDELNHFLLEQQAAGRRVVVIVDEAQDLEPSVLEQLRLLSNLETERVKLLQIILVGQPELRAILARPELAQLDQRVTLRWHLGPLNAEETGAYVRHRLRVAAATRETVHFTPAAFRLIYRFSRGVPRLINVLCHRALLIGFTREARKIGWKIMRQAMQELRRDQQREAKRSFSWRRVTAATLGAASLLSVTGVLFGVVPFPGWQPGLASSHKQEGTTPAVERAQSQVSPPQTDPAKPADAQATLAAAAPSASAPPSATAPTSAEERTTPDDTFRQYLGNLELVDSAVRSTNGLLRAWGVDELQTKEWQNGILDFSAIARTRQLEYQPLSSTVTLLSQLDLPVILELTTPAHQDTRFVLLLGLADGHCRVLLDQEREVPTRVLDEYWSGKAHFFWKDFENVGFLLTVGSVGQNVKRLHALLSKVKGASDGKFFPTRLDTFGRQTEEAIVRFQKAKHIPSDGVVGPLTLVLLYNSLTNYPHPSLGAGERSVTGENENPERTGKAAQGKDVRKTALAKERT
ncbi:MAG TPA: AAA family ATPase [Candidatus Binatia bacterium]|jgi:general secretion pathway protein A|nr:AAA family ATPase [Candidatus Binatia bacterium]